MATTLLQRSTSVALAAMYLAVGLAGESLHYWQSSPAPASTARSTDPAKSGGYFHCHGPDFHWHYHGPAPSGEEVAEEETDSSPPEYDEHLPAYRSGIRHPAHACPLLAMVATLKLGHAPLASFLLPAPRPTPLGSGFSPAADHPLIGGPLARGPPPSATA